jgi:hypothetical protein
MSRRPRRPEAVRRARQRRVFFVMADRPQWQVCMLLGTGQVLARYSLDRRAA